MSIGARGNNNSLILQRGFAEVQGNEGIRMRDENEPLFDCALLDTRPIVNKLASAMREEPCHYFFTYSKWKKTLDLQVISKYLENEERIMDHCGFLKHVSSDCTLLTHGFQSSAALLK